MDYAHVRLLHISCASLSISLFLLRGALQLVGVDWRRRRWLRIVPHINDTVLLAAAITLSIMSHQYPVAQAWLSAKVLALLVYIVVGSVAFRPGVPPAQQALAFVGALATVGYIVAVAISRSATLGLW